MGGPSAGWRGIWGGRRWWVCTCDWWRATNSKKAPRGAFARRGAGGDQPRLQRRESLRCIATRLGRSPSTISREIARNGGRWHYRASRADAAARDRTPATEAVQARGEPAAGGGGGETEAAVVAAADRSAAVRAEMGAGRSTTPGPMHLTMGQSNGQPGWRHVQLRPHPRRGRTNSLRAAVSLTWDAGGRRRAMPGSDRCSPVARGRAQRLMSHPT